MIHEILWQSILAGLATLLGSLIVLALGIPSDRLLALFLGFAAGVMSAVVAFDLIPSALQYGNLITTITGFFLGLFLMLGLDIIISLLPNLKYTGSFSKDGHYLKMGYLIAIGIALHDLPEGVAIAVGYSAKESLGLLIALCIGLHNIPEGMATAAPLRMGGMSKWKIICTCLLISFFTPLGAYVGICLVYISKNFVCLLLSLAGGAMAFIVRNELIPESYKKDLISSGFGFLLGIMLILVLGIIHH